jgi:polyhydroxybutyrate depolymerase
MLRSLFIFLLLPMIFTTTPARACGADTDCVIGDRTYRIMMPEGHDGHERIGAIVFAHGYRGSAAGVMRNKSLARTASELGVAIIAANSADNDWDIPGTPSNIQATGDIEFTYFDHMIDHASSSFAIDRNRLMAAGFSAGGMMVWNLACRRSDLFSVFVPMSGTFWEPEPPTCDTPAASIIHIHGDSDPTVPLGGRRIQATRQGDVNKALEMYAEYGAFGPPASSVALDLTCENRSNDEGKMLNLCLFNGGHSFKVKYIKWAWETFAEKGQI